VVLVRPSPPVRSPPEVPGPGLPDLCADVDGSEVNHVLQGVFCGILLSFGREKVDGRVRNGSGPPPAPYSWGPLRPVVERWRTDGPEQGRSVRRHRRDGRPDSGKLPTLRPVPRDARRWRIPLPELASPR